MKKCARIWCERCELEEYAAEQNVEVLQIVDETQEIELEPQEEMIGFGYERFLNMTDRCV